MATLDASASAADSSTVGLRTGGSFYFAPGGGSSYTGTPPATQKASLWIIAGVVGAFLLVLVLITRK